MNEVILLNERTNPLLLAVIFMIVAAILGGFFALFFQGFAAEYQQGEIFSKASGEDAGIITAETILPSVVGIRATEKTMVNGLPTLNESSGSGVILSGNGYIVTNHHVIADYNEISVVFSDHSEAEAKLIGSDRYTDLALLKVNKSGLKAAATAKTPPRVGQTTYAVGNPGGEDFAGSVTKGIVSGIDRTLVTENGASILLLQTDAAINPGNSGGALCNAAGEIIGINVLKISESGFEGMGFAIPIATVRSVVDEIRKTGSVSRGSLGIYLLATVTEGVASVYQAGIDHGVLIGLREGGAAEKAGLKDYDIITALNGEAIEDMYELQQKIFTMKPGDSVRLTIWRNDRYHEYTISLEEQDDI